MSPIRLKSPRTWVVEATIILWLLTSIAELSDSWLTVFPVFMTFLHAQVADRLREYALIGGEPPECAAKERRYFFLKEISWILIFIYLNAWPALVGSIALALYPIWRTWYRDQQSKRI